MIKFINISSDEPLKILKDKYDTAVSMEQKGIEALAISSYCAVSKKVNSRYVNLKIIDGDSFIFFTNYNSSKAKEFLSHNDIATILFWPSIKTQIRMKAKIKKTSDEFNQEYFFNRSKEKNALAISSNQSKQIDSFEQVKENYNKSLNMDDLRTCPKYWGGYSFTPYEIEFWEGNKYRLNKRNLYIKDNTSWNHFILEP